MPDLFRLVVVDLNSPIARLDFLHALPRELADLVLIELPLASIMPCFLV